MATQLVKIDIRWDVNEYGEATPYYLHNGILMSVPDTKGWPTRAEAIAYVESKWGKIKSA